MPSLIQKHAHMKGQRSNHHRPYIQISAKSIVGQKTAKPLHVLWFEIYVSNSMHALSFNVKTPKEIIYMPPPVGGFGHVDNSVHLGKLKRNNDCLHCKDSSR